MKFATFRRDSTVAIGRLTGDGVGIEVLETPQTVTHAGVTDLIGMEKIRSSGGGAPPNSPESVQRSIARQVRGNPRCSVTAWCR